MYCGVYSKAAHARSQVRPARRSESARTVAAALHLPAFWQTCAHDVEVLARTVTEVTTRQPDMFEHVVICCYVVVWSYLVLIVSVSDFLTDKPWSYQVFFHVVSMQLTKVMRCSTS